MLLYVYGHLITMLILSVIGFLTNDGVLCSENINYIWIIVVAMINPFIFNFFNSTLDYFICP